MPIPDAVTSRRMEARAARVEALARIIAAELMAMKIEGLEDDPLGSSLPTSLCKQFLARAEAIMTLIGAPKGDVG
jgi:hypothetical protein